MKPTEEENQLSASRQRRLNSIVADATKAEIARFPWVSPTAKVSRRYAAKKIEFKSPTQPSDEEA